MNILRVKKLALAVVSVVAIAFNAMPVNAATIKAASYEEELVNALNEQEAAAAKEIRKITIQNGYTMEAKSVSTSHLSNMGYMCYRPDSNKDEAKPLIVYLHGKDGNGTNVNKLLQIEGIINYIDKGLIYPDAVVISPQIPVGSNWVNMANDVMQLINTVVEEENIDTTRISLTGASLGGIGTFYIGYTNPSFFSAIVPVCGNVNASRCSTLTDVPVWIFHGTQDFAMGFSCKDADKVINNAGGNSTLTMLQGEGHEIRHVYYDEEYDLINWMISQQRTTE